MVIFFIYLGIPDLIFATVSYTVNTVGCIASGSITFDVSFDGDFEEDTGCNTNFWGISGINGGDFISDFVPSTTRNLHYVLSNVSIEYLEPEFACSDDGVNYLESGLNFIGQLGLEPCQYITILPAAPPSEAGVSNTPPQVKLETKISGTYRGSLSFNYSAFDFDFGKGALKSLPMNFFYCDEMSTGCQEIAKDQPNTGSYVFDTTKVPDGNYKFRVAALDGYDSFGHDFSETFTIDNTGPTFDVSITPASPIKEKDKIELKIISSEELKTKPNVKIIQEGAQPIQLEVRGNGKEFYTSFSPLRGFPGKAIISISGEDLVGNLGEIITSGGTFFIERFGPPPPTIKEIFNNQVFTQPLINISGTSQPNTKILLTLNGVKQFTTQVLDDGSFNIKDVPLSKANKGYNTLSIFGINEKGEQSGEVVLKIKLNSPPKVVITSSFEEIISGEKEIRWNASDQNDDKLIFSIEYSNDGGITWDTIASDISTTSYRFDTTQIADGPDYLLRVTADDSTEKTSSISKKFTIKNNLPHISLDIPANYFTNATTFQITGTVTSPQNEIVSTEYSLDQGKTWQKVKIIDISIDSRKEKFEISVSSPLADGKYVLLIRVKDNLGHFVKISRTFNIDTIPPTTQIITPVLEKAVDDGMDANLELNGLQVVFQGKTEPKARIELILGDKNYKSTADKNGEFNIKDVTLKTHSINEFSLFAVDLADNIFQMKGTVISNNPPQVSVLNLKEGVYLGGVKEINWQAEDLDGDPLNSQILYQDKKGEWIALVKNIPTLQTTATVYKLDLSKIPNGDYKMKIIVGDGLNETEAVSNVFIDNIYPKGTFNVVGSQLTNNAKPSFSGQASDDFSGVQYVEYSFNNVDWYKAITTESSQELAVNFKFQHNFPLTDGNYQVRVRITDRAGNITYLEPQDLTIDTTPPRIGSNLISSGALILFPDEDGKIKLFENTDYKILVSIGGDAEEVSLKSKETIFNLNFNKSMSLWESQFNFETPGDYSLEINARDGAGNSKTQEINALKVLPRGYVYNEKNNQRISGAKITLYVFDQITNSWLVWDGEAFNQKNPQKTEDSGEYGFLVPPGKYKLKITSRDFENITSKELEPKKNYLISLNIPLTERKGIFKIFNEILNYFE